MPGHQLGDAEFGQAKQGIEFAAGERRTLGSALHLDETAAAGHHHVHVGIAGGVFGVIEVENRRTLEHADRDRGNHVLERVLFQHALLEQLAHRIGDRDAGARDRCGAGAAVRLQHVAIDGELSFAEQAQIDYRAQAAADQALDLLGAAALLALGRLARAAGVGGARQHAVLGGQPALALAAQEVRHTVLDAGGAQHAGVAEADQHRAFGVSGEAALDRDRA